MLSGTHRLEMSIIHLQDLLTIIFTSEVGVSKWNYF
jgi:hypothetical protein